MSSHIGLLKQAKGENNSVKNEAQIVAGIFVAQLNMVDRLEVDVQNWDHSLKHIYKLN